MTVDRVIWIDLIPTVDRVIWIDLIPTGLRLFSTRQSAKKDNGVWKAFTVPYPCTRPRMAVCADSLGLQRGGFTLSLSGRRHCSCPTETSSSTVLIKLVVCTRISFGPRLRLLPYSWPASTHWLLSSRLLRGRLMQCKDPQSLSATAAPQSYDVMIVGLNVQRPHTVC